MKAILYLLIGILFGITMFKSQAASWYRIYEMFTFQSFHMYGIIGSALITGIITTFFIKRFKIKSFYGKPIIFFPKEMSYKRYIFGGVIFGLGWALTGACPGPMFTLAGAGFTSIFIVILFAVIGTFIYGLIRNKIPH